MQEVMDWIDRENARYDFVIQGREKGLLLGLVCRLIARYLAKRDPVPIVLKAALSDCV